ncbi:MAG TPA: hypothetical protein VHE61_20245 [Opitutaceae bacterium]|nr:hypothetical protein [Opitutaceae bacterium]
MTPHEKAINAVNARIERLQAALREASVDTAQRFLLQSIVATVGAAEALNDLAAAVGEYARRRHAEVKQTTGTFAAQHAESLKSGQELLEKLKASPTDRSIRKEIERAQSSMAAAQKAVRRASNALRRELAPGLALVDAMAVSVRRFSEAEQTDALKRVIKSVVAQTRDFFASQPGVSSKGVIDAAAWEKTAVAEINQSAGFHDAYARTGHQVIVALELMTLAASESPPQSAEEATRRAHEAVAARLTALTARLAAN